MPRKRNQSVQVNLQIGNCTRRILRPQGAQLLTKHYDHEIIHFYIAMNLPSVSII